MNIAAILLAAGQSSRMKSDKLLLPYRSACLIDFPIRALLDVVEIGQIIIVVRPDFRYELGWDSRIEVVRNPYYEEGMSTSLRVGVQAAALGTDAFLLALGDMPFLSAEKFRRVIREFQESSLPIVVPRYRGKRGHPVILDVQFRDALLSQKGDVGAREILRSFPHLIHWLDVDDPSFTLDIDTYEDYQAILAEK